MCIFIKNLILLIQSLFCECNHQQSRHIKQSLFFLPHPLGHQHGCNLYWHCLIPLSFLARITPKPVNSYFQFCSPSIQYLYFATKVIFLQMRSIIFSLLHLNSYKCDVHISIYCPPASSCLPPAYLPNLIVQISNQLPVPQPSRKSYRNTLGFFMLSWKLFFSLWETPLSVMQQTSTCLQVCD